MMAQLVPEKPQLTPHFNNYRPELLENSSFFSQLTLQEYYISNVLLCHYKLTLQV